MTKKENDNPMNYKKAADEGDVDSMCIYAELLYKGKEISMNKQESALYFKKAADQGNLKAMLNYANMVGKGDGLPMNKEESARYFKMAADEGEVNSMFYYAQMLYRGDGIPINKEESAHYFKMAAESGKRDAMHNYAMMAYKGDGITENKDEAMKYFKMAADKGQVQSMYQYAMLLSKSEEKSDDENEVKKYLKMAADKGQIQSMYHYAVLASKSDDFEEKKMSADYFKKAADKGQIQAMVNYASMLSKGDLVQQNKDEAAFYYKMAADRGNAPAKTRLRELKKAGFGLKTDQPPNLSQSFMSKNRPEIIRPDQQARTSPRFNRKQPFSGHMSPKTENKKSAESTFSGNMSPKKSEVSDEKLPDLHPQKTAENQPKPPEKLPDSKEEKSPRNKKHENVTINYDNTESGRFRGIIHYLTEKVGGNVHKEGVVNVTSSSVYRPRPLLPFLSIFVGGDYNPYNCVDLDNKESCFESDLIPNSWICYDFKGMKVQPNMYSIRTYINGNNHLQTWVIEGSNNGEDWTILDSRMNDKSINDVGLSNTFKLKSNDETYRYLRLRQTGPSTGGSTILNVSALEFFGTLVGSIKKSKKINHSSSSSSSLTTKKTTRISEKLVTIKFDGKDTGRFNGIIHYLSDKCGGGNVHKEGLVEVTSSSVIPSLSFLLSEGDEDYNPYNCVDLENKESCFESGDEPDSWICYDFLKLKIRPNMYSIRSKLEGDNHLQTWVIEGSNDKETWTILDSRRNERSLDGQGFSNTFKITKNGNDFYRYLRLKQTEGNTMSSNIISISALEFFGSILDGDKSPLNSSELLEEESEFSSSISISTDSEVIDLETVEEIEDPIKFEYDETDEGRFKGIINHLSSKCDGGNVHLEGLVDVTSSSIIPSNDGLPLLFRMVEEDYSPYNCVELDNPKSCFESANEPNSWICYDFRKLKVKPNMYSIRSYVNGNNHMLSWVIEGSNNKIKWTVLDERKNDRSLDEIGKSVTFKMNKKPSDCFYRYLRLRQTGRSTIDTDIISISALEFFGEIIGKITKGPKREKKGGRNRNRPQFNDDDDDDDNDSIPGPRPKKRRNKHRKKHHKKHHHRRRRSSSSSSSSSSSYYYSSDSTYFSANPVEGISDEPTKIEYDGTDTGRFKGIIHFLSDKCGGGNVHKEGLVEVTSSSVIPSLSFLLSEGDEDYNPYNCVDLENRESCFESSNKKNSWICYDFLNLRVKPDAYSIRTYINGDNHLQSWVIEGSNNMVTWNILDERVKEKSLNDTGKSNTFKISMKLDDDEYYRYLRLRQTGCTTEGMNILNISALEYFGSFYCRIVVI